MVRRKSTPAEPPPALDLTGFGDVSDDLGLSLEELGATYAEMLGQGHDPYSELDEAEAAEPTLDDPADEADEAEAVDEPSDEATDPDDGCELSPRAIVEAMLFAGHPENEPLTAKQIAGLMRGVRAEEVDESIRELNESYVQDGRPYRIESVGAGYVLRLCEEFFGLRDKFYGRVREARLTQPAIDVLAVVAYHPGMNRDEIDELRGKPSAALLNQLVRRELLRVERPKEKPRIPRYFTTPRFLDLFGLDSLESLPQAQEMDRSF